MIAVNDLRQGALFEQDGRILEVLEFRRHKMARAKSVVNIKVRDIETGSVRDLTFKGSENVQDADVENVGLDFVYHDQRKGQLFFTNPHSNERIGVDENAVGSVERGYLVGGVSVAALIEPNSKPTRIYTVTLPNTVDMKVIQAPPSEKGNTATGGTKPVTVETGIKINTPFFIADGDTIRVNTTTGSYIERVSG